MRTLTPEMLEERVYRYPHLPEDLEAAVLLIDKPQRWTSFDVVHHLRRLLGVRKVGHAGTLDPLATGLLICLIGKATRWMTYFMAQDKLYEGVMRLGEITPSYDAETEVVERRPWAHLTEADLEQARQQFIGTILQQVPAYSAVKVKGKRLHAQVRAGQVAEPPVRQVHIYAFTLLARAGADVTFQVHCSKGTYIRSLVHDFGQALGCGAHLVSLRRLRSGPYRVEEAWPLSAFEAAWRQRSLSV
ncbi:tRNA pseudouridine(55) synthase TruB [Rhodothermus bifroesti]|uniref:tRNA pseudouridine synthase B n=1 Tax=Rhodothermus marinus TaxID=29549 RepID=A0A7V2F6Q7_RHOMR|nr:tRNA pseudouridine(55) synthase TruB [Rhodothermus bifroesti]GBD00576.1 tRNA pseudouridine synthase B [bacterium HR18]